MIEEKVQECIKMLETIQRNVIPCGDNVKPCLIDDTETHVKRTLYESQKLLSEVLTEIIPVWRSPYITFYHLEKMVKDIEAIEDRIKSYIDQANGYFSDDCKDFESGHRCKIAANVMTETLNMLDFDYRYDILYSEEEKKFYMKKTKME